MQPFEFIAARGERIEEPLLVEALRQSKILLFARDAVEVGEDFAHPAVFLLKHALHLLVAQRIGPVPYPARHFLCCLQRLLVAGQGVHVKMPGHDFVIGVERSPNLDSIAQAVE